MVFGERYPAPRPDFNLSCSSVDYAATNQSSNKSIVEFEMCWLRDAMVMGSLGAFFRDNDNLLSLSMHSCKLTVQGWRVLANSLKNRSEKNIDASFGVQEGFDSGDECQIDDESVSEIIGSFESYSSLERLSIQQTRMGYKGCTAWRIFWTNRLQTLTILI